MGVHPVVSGRWRGVRLIPHTAHPDPDLIDIGIGELLRRRDTTLGNDRDAIGYFEQFFEFLGNYQDRGALIT